MTINIKIILVCLTILPIYSKAQSIIPIEDVNAYKASFLNNSNLKEVFIKKDYYRNHNIKSLKVYGKYSNDSIYQIGPYYRFFHDGNIKFFSNTDWLSLYPKDTSVSFALNGNIKEKKIYVVISKSDINGLDTIKSIEEMGSVQYRYLVQGENYIIRDCSNNMDSLIVYKKVPLSEVSIWFINGIKKSYMELSFDIQQSKYVVKKSIIFKEDGSKLGSVENKTKVRPEFLNIKRNEVKWDAITYSSDTSSKTNFQIYDYLVYFKSFAQDRQFHFLSVYKGYYTIENETTNTYIAGINDFRKETPESVNNILFITYQNNNYKVLTANEVDEYKIIYFGGSTDNEYKAFRNGNYKVFIKKVYQGNVEVFEKPQIFKGDPFCYYVYNRAKQKVTIISPYSSFTPEDTIAEIGNVKNIKVEVFDTTEAIREYLIGLPGIDEKMKKRINSGSFPVSNLVSLFEKYNL